MTVRRIEPGKRMSQAVVHGNVVYLAGQVGADVKYLLFFHLRYFDKIIQVVYENWIIGFPKLPAQYLKIG